MLYTMTQGGICSTLASHLMITGHGELEALGKAKEAAQLIFNVIDMIW